jgi:hypothetical protein
MVWFFFGVCTVVCGAVGAFAPIVLIDLAERVVQRRVATPMDANFFMMLGGSLGLGIGLGVDIATFFA